MVGNLSIYDFCDSCFSVASFRQAYSHPIYPIPDANKPKFVPEQPSLLPPDVRKQAGRPATKRKEATGAGLKKPIKCSRCKEVGHHNKTTCRALVNQ